MNVPLLRWVPTSSRRCCSRGTGRRSRTRRSTGATTSWARSRRCSWRTTASHPTRCILPRALPRHTAPSRHVPRRPRLRLPGACAERPPAATRVTHARRGTGAQGAGGASEGAGGRGQGRRAAERRSAAGQGAAGQHRFRAADARRSGDEVLEGRPGEGREGGAWAGPAVQGWAKGTVGDRSNAIHCSYVLTRHRSGARRLLMVGDVVVDAARAVQLLPQHHAADLVVHHHAAERDGAPARPRGLPHRW